MSAEIDEKRIQHVVVQLLSRAHKEGASDVHLLPQTTQLKVYFRIEGIIQERPHVHAAFMAPVLNLLKVQGGLDISERRRAQDGAFSVRLSDEQVRFRISTLPTQYGEKMVLRVLGGEALARTLEQVGMDARNCERVRGLLRRPSGILLVGGPTGSGKTSTLYALLRDLMGKPLSIVTLEDPIEFHFAGIAQSQTNPQAGHDFAGGLRAILRQDPDIIMVGEIRDIETARIAFKAALTGHLVLSSLHTSSAAETVVRLLDMGLERYVVASALRGILAQRLVRLLCPHCRVASSADDALKTSAAAGSRPLVGALRASSEGTFYTASGCKVCHGTGYSQRTGLFEVLPNDDGLSRLIRNEGASQQDYAKYMVQHKLPTFHTAGVRKLREGTTTIDELLRVV